MAVNITWMPRGAKLAMATLENLGTLYLQESSMHQGFYYVVYVSDSINYTIKATSRDYVERIIFDWLPGKYTRNCRIENLNWAFLDSKDDFVKNELISDFLSGDYKHLKNQDEEFGRLTSEVKKLESLERVMEKNLKAEWYENGLMFKEIRDGFMYKGSHSSFAAYLLDRFEMTEPEVNNMIVKAELERQIKA